MDLISDLPLGTLIRIADSDGGEDAANYEIADINNLVSGGVVLVRKNIHSKSAFGSSTAYPGSTLDNTMALIYNNLPVGLQKEIKDATFDLEGSGSITRKVFALTYTMMGFGANHSITEGKALQRYNSNDNRIKTYNGSAASWWLSSRSTTDHVRVENRLGDASSVSRPSSSMGVVPAFVLPSKTPYDPIPNPDGSYNLFQNTTISELPLGTLINIGTDGGADTPNYEIADINNLVSGGVVLVRKNIHSKSAFGSSAAYSNSTLDNKMTSIYNSLPEKLQSKIMDATFALEGSGSITRKVFALTYTMVGFGDNNGTTEGKALQRYNSNDNRKKQYSGSAWSWWLSSRRDTSYPRDVSTTGAVDYNRPDFSTGVVPAFAIPQSVMLEDSANTDGSYNIKYTEKISCTVNMGSTAEMPKSALPIINCNGNLTLQICNNANDTNPAWETAANETVHNFTNTTKTAAQWAIGLEIDISTAGENLFLNEPVVLTM